MTCLYFLAETLHPEAQDLWGFDERDYRGCATGLNGVQVCAKVTVPCSRQRILLLFARAECDAYSPAGAPGLNERDL